MNIDNPTKTDIKLIREVQERKWREVQSKQHWTHRDYQNALYCGMTWEGRLKEWFIL